MTSITPGPWLTRRLSSSIRVYSQTANNVEICSITKSGFIKDANDRKLADATLIAAAPELLAALLNLADASRSYLQGMDVEDIHALEAARTAIRKATGAQS